jgi:hypothetical protein
MKDFFQDFHGFYQVFKAVIRYRLSEIRLFVIGFIVEFEKKERKGV